MSLGASFLPKLLPKSSRGDPHQRQGNRSIGTVALQWRAMSRLDRITSDPEICHGQPVVRGLRYPVQTLLELMSSGMTFDEILADYEDLERDDLLAALEFGALTAGGQKVPIAAV